MFPNNDNKNPQNWKTEKRYRLENNISIIAF